MIDRIASSVGHRLVDWSRKRASSRIGKSAATLSLVGDRDIEWSWIASHLPPGPGEVLDFGSGRSFLGLIAARKGFNVVALDARPIQGLYTHPRLSFVQGDFLEVSFPQSYFDVVINCSTIEHIGLVGRYQFTKEHTNGDFEAMSRLSSLMKPSGVMLLTIPVSYDAVFSPLHRVYGPKRLPRLIEGYLVEREEYWVKNPQNIWVVTDKQDALGREPQERLYGLGCFVLRRPGV